MNWLLIYVWVFVTVALIAGFILPQILLIAFRKNLFDDIDPRKIHKGAVPRLGGIAFFPAILFSILIVMGLCFKFYSTDASLLAGKDISGLCFIGCAIIILYLIGMADDLIGLKYRAKFGSQILSGLLIVAGGIYIDNLHGFLWVYMMPMWAAVVLTVLLTVFITNAINLIDGIDGLASGLSAIACVFYGLVLTKAGCHIYAMLAYATLGALVPFFYYNVFGNAKKHSKIFMGDTGALTIGLILSVLSIRITQIDDAEFPTNSAVLAFAPLLIPCLDVVRVYIHRIKAHRNPFLPDKTHIHHKLLALGMHQRVAMPTIVVSSMVLIALNYVLSSFINITLLFIIDLGLWYLVNNLLSRAIRCRERKTGEKLYE